MQLTFSNIKTIENEKLQADRNLLILLPYLHAVMYCKKVKNTDENLIASLKFDFLKFSSSLLLHTAVSEGLYHPTYISKKWPFGKPAFFNQ